MQNDKTIRQKYLGRVGLIIFLGAISAFSAPYTATYLPALNDMTTYFGGTSEQAFRFFSTLVGGSVLLWSFFGLPRARAQAAGA